MNSSRLVPLYVTLGALAILGLAGVPLLVKGSKPAAATRPATESPEARAERRSGNPMDNPPGAVDRLVMVDSAEAFKAGKLDGVELQSNEAGTGVRLVMEHKGESEHFPRRATWTSPEVQADFPFTDLIPSWNLLTPADTGVYFEVRTRDAKSASWSPWMYIGYWGRVRAVHKVDEFEHGAVHMDNLKLDDPADAYQIRAQFQSFQPIGNATPALRRVAVCYSGVVKDQAEYERLLWKPEIKGTWAVDLPVPYRPQGDSTKALASQICSPTSTSMVMQYFGVDRPTVENAYAIYDQDTGIFGNWGRAIARASELGLDGYIMRFRNFDQVKAMIAQGQPIICSIKAKKGDFHGPYIYEDTAGHLIVLRGLTADGNCIVNDPARRAKGNGFVYNQDDIKRVWIDHGGVGYVIHKPVPAAVVSTQPLAKSGS